jgi:hypothetical protein
MWGEVTNPTLQRIARPVGERPKNSKTPKPHLTTAFKRRQQALKIKKIIKFSYLSLSFGSLLLFGHIFASYKRLNIFKKSNPFARMNKFLLSIQKAFSILVFFLFFQNQAHALDTLVVHCTNLVAEAGSYKADGQVVSAEIFKKYQEEHRNWETKYTGKLVWIRRLSTLNRLIEQGLFCGKNAASNNIKYDNKGQIIYKKLYTVGMDIKACPATEVGRRANEEIFDRAAGMRIVGTWLDGQKHDQWFYYDKTGAVLGLEAYEKGKLLVRKGKIFKVRPDNTFEVSVQPTVGATASKAVGN